MTGTVLVGTRDGLYTLAVDGERWSVVDHVLHGHEITCVLPMPDTPHTIWVGTYGDGLLVTRDGGGLWEPVDIDATFVRALCALPGQPSALLVGTEPANIFWSTDGGKTWQDAGLYTWPQASSWHLPYSPRAGAVRTFAVHPKAPHRLFAGIEVGGLLRSDDSGRSWHLQGNLHPDVHTLAAHPADPDILLAATGGGVYLSRDAGTSWTCLVDAYTRAVIYHPARPHIAFAGPARQVGREGRILATKNGGATWILASTGLPVPMPGMVDAFSIAGQPSTLRLLAVLSDGRLIWSEVDRMAWRPVPVSLHGVRCCAFTEPHVESSHG
ncbi:MAG: hypothetical protein Q9O62_06245 [Ardenticatenia bacterium]|nr:hypothetical protein [Ardenticatenia bacterium]